ncbi:CoA transferase [Burkholderia sp. Ac-20353]|uniref:CaiB/BaiF CoA transferase family protein n=1 Tax=Burkholderia sp. Ac-20353 TaxID=2703894 RepID=UPI00197BB47A|nr:CoA transferase [Burkholderia sp. Ac-20353]MBN3785966.1 CoA transferase [Burkholderia sp. Ac-20353]
MRNLRVLDLTHFLSGPFATMILGDLGAEIIKIEPPGGDPTRQIPPFHDDGVGTFYFSVNRNKRSVVLDLKRDEDRETFLSLVETADVVCENFRPGVLDRLGIGYDALVKRKPDIVLCSIFGFDNEGEYADRPAVDTLVQALSGIMSLTGERDGPPARVGIQIGDTGAGLWAAIAVLAGLHGRHADGKPRHVEVSLFDAQLGLLVWQAQDFLSFGTVYTRMGTRHATLPPSQAFRCADGRYVYATPSALPHWWRGYCEALHLPDLATDARFADLSLRQRNRDALEALLEAQFASRKSGYWIARFREHDVPAALVQTVKEAFEFPTVERRNMVVHVQDANGRVTRMVGNPVKTGSEERFAAPPGLGEHTSEILERMNAWSDDNDEHGKYSRIA